MNATNDAITVVPSRARIAGTARAGLRSSGGGAVQIDPRVHGRTSIACRIFCWAGARQRELSARVHAGADQRAQDRGWQIAASAGRFGVAGRLYRDPRFDDLRRNAAAPVRAADGHVLINGRTSSQGGQ